MYRTIMLHRSVLSATSPFGWTKIGHPLILRLLCGIFQRCPPMRRVFPSWDVAAVFAVFSSLPFDVVPLQRKVAFLLTKASSRHPSVGFAPLQLGIYDQRRLCSLLPVSPQQDYCPDHLGPPIMIRRLPRRTFLSVLSPLWKTFWSFGALSGSRTIISFLFLLFCRCRLQRSWSCYAGPFALRASSRLLVLRATFLSQMTLLV